MSRPCSEIYCNCQTPHCQYIGPNADLQRAKNDLIAYNQRLSELSLWDRLMKSREHQIHLSEILARIRKAEFMLAEERKRHGA